MAERRDTKNRKLNKGEYQKKDGRYSYKYTDVDGNSRVVYSWTLTPTDRPPKGKRSAKCLRDMEREINKDLQDGISAFASKKVTLNDFFDKYMELNTGIKPTTRATYSANYNNHIRNTLGRKAISEIKYSDIRAFYNKLVCDSILSVASLKNMQALLHPVFALAVRDSCIRNNPADNALYEIRKLEQSVKKKQKALTIPQQEAFVKFTSESEKYSYWCPVFTVLLGTGMRIGELSALTWNDCDFENNIITVSRGLCVIKNESTGQYEEHMLSTKTAAGIRKIPMFEDVKRVLQKERMRQMREGFSTLACDGHTGFVFFGKKGGFINKNALNYTIKRIVRRYNLKETELARENNRKPILLPHFSAHTLRHTFCTRMCENEANIKVIQEIMGHSDISVTMNIYNEATLDEKKRSFRDLEGKFKIC